MVKIIVIDDERYVRNTLYEALTYESYSVDVSESCSAAVEMLKHTKYDLIITDVKMEGMNGIEFLKYVTSNDATFHIPVIVISGHGNVEMAVTVIKSGAFDFIEKPLDLGNVLSVVKNALDKKESVKKARTTISRKTTTSKNIIIGESDSIKQVNILISKVATSESRVFITGANGTGKELVAKEIHRLSHRASFPFVEVNCAAIPSELIESEMFGHEKGAFTSADKVRKGKFEQAHGGTLFLDEIGDLSFSAQAKLLRALQERKICRVGGDKNINTDVRIIAATNKNLLQEIKNNNFREDLYHRLAVAIINVPDLKDRKGDIPILINHFIEITCKNESMPKREITDEALSALVELEWRGNIRELLNIVERLIVFTTDVGNPDVKITKKDVEEYVIKYL